MVLKTGGVVTVDRGVHGAGVSIYELGTTGGVDLGSDCAIVQFSGGPPLLICWLMALIFLYVSGVQSTFV